MRKRRRTTSSWYGVHRHYAQERAAEMARITGGNTPAGKRNLRLMVYCKVYDGTRYEMARHFVDVYDKGAVHFLNHSNLGLEYLYAEGQLLGGIHSVQGRYNDVVEGSGCHIVAQIIRERRFDLIGDYIGCFSERLFEYLKVLQKTHEVRIDMKEYLERCEMKPMPESLRYRMNAIQEVAKLRLARKVHRVSTRYLEKINGSTYMSYGSVYQPQDSPSLGSKNFVWYNRLDEFPKLPG